MKKLILIDGTAIIYRSYYAFIKRPLINSKGMNTSAIYGTINTFIKLVSDFSAENVVISFDRKEPTFRHKMFDAYKANRPPMPDDLVSQLKPVTDFFNQINVPELSMPGYEADDVIATLAEKFKKDFEVLMITGDKDYLQLLDDNVSIFDPFKNKIKDLEYLKEKYDLRSEQFIDFLAITGDTADNIPGIKGIGEKGALKLLHEYGSLENIYENIDNISSKSIVKKLNESRENAFLSKELVKIDRNVPVNIVNDKQVEFKKENLLNSLSFLEKYEISSLVKRIRSIVPEESLFEMMGVQASSETGSLKLNYRLIGNNVEFDELVKILKNYDIIAIDTETTSVHPVEAEIVGVSLSTDSCGYYIPLAHQMFINLDTEYIVNTLKDTLKGKMLIGHNIKYDMQIFEKYGWIIENSVFDTMIASYLIDPQMMQHNMDKCAERELNYETIPISNLIGKGKKQITFDLVDVHTAAKYAAEDAFITYKLYEVYSKRLNELDLVSLYDNIEIPLIKVLEKIESTGVYVSEEILGNLAKEAGARLAELTKWIYDKAGYPFNLNSTQQLSKLLFEEMKIPPVKKTKTGFSTDNSVLEALAENHEIAEKIIEYRMLNKLESTYIKALPKLISPKTGRVHSSFNQTVASTGRLSSSNPNLQNIPIRSEFGRRIRNAFTVSDPDYVILAADYSQVELRVMALLSGDENLISAFRNNEDIHTQTASLVFNVAKEEVTSGQRAQAKAVNFGIIYGMGHVRLSKELNISRNDAKDFIDNYFSKFPAIKKYMDRQTEFVKANGYTSTLFGRKLYLPGINSDNSRTAGDAARVAINMPIQGTAADIIKLAMINIHEKTVDDHCIKMILQVHDELVFEVHKEKLEEATELIRTAMENVNIPDSSVPFKVDIGIGKNWFEAH